MKKEHIPKTLIIILFILFLMFYLSDQFGYYDYKQHRKVTLTNEKIEEFENDIKNNQEIDGKKYLEEVETDYRNELTKTATNISLGINKYVKTGVESVFKAISKLVGDDE